MLRGFFAVRNDRRQSTIAELDDRTAICVGTEEMSLGMFALEALVGIPSAEVVKIVGAPSMVCRKPGALHHEVVGFSMQGRVVVGRCIIHEAGLRQVWHIGLLSVPVIKPTTSYNCTPSPFSFSLTCSCSSSLGGTYPS